jgi:hypothetical protein
MITGFFYHEGHEAHEGGFGGAAHLVGKSSKPLLQTSLCVGLERLFPRSLTSAAKPQGITAAFEINTDFLTLKTLKRQGTLRNIFLP